MRTKLRNQMNCSRSSGERDTQVHRLRNTRLNEQGWGPWSGFLIHSSFFPTMKNIVFILITKGEKSYISNLCKIGNWSYYNFWNDIKGHFFNHLFSIKYSPPKWQTFKNASSTWEVFHFSLLCPEPFSTKTTGAKVHVKSLILTSGLGD